MYYSDSVLLLNASEKNTILAELNFTFTYYLIDIMNITIILSPSYSSTEHTLYPSSGTNFQDEGFFYLKTKRGVFQRSQKERGS